MNGPSREPAAGKAASDSPALADDARRAIVIGWGVLASFFIGLGGWAAFAPLDSAAIAQGVVKVEGNRKTVQHLEGGIVRELLVREGDYVRSDRVLIVLDDAQARAAVDLYAKQHAELRAQEARLLAERSDADAIAFPADLRARRGESDIHAVLDGQQQLFESRRATLRAQLRLIEQRIAQSRQQITGLEGRLDAYRRQVQSVREENRGLRALFERGYVPRQRMLELERDEAALDGQIVETEAQIIRTRQQIEESELQMAQVRTDRLAQVANDLRDLQVRLLEVVPRLQTAQDTLRRTRIRAPYDGHVVGLSAFSVGGVITPGEPILDIVPAVDELIVEATVNVDDVRDVRVGMKAEVHLTSYRQRDIPIVHGTVLQVSADRLTDPRTGSAHYLAQIRIDRAELAELPDARLTPGMSALVMIPTGSRTALDYLLRPLTESLRKSFRER
jgi:HlyD family type I secretion membrane fusion protein